MGLSLTPFDKKSSSTAENKDSLLLPTDPHFIVVCGHFVQHHNNFYLNDFPSITN